MKLTRIKEVYRIEQDENNKIEITINKDGMWEIYRECVKDESFIGRAQEALEKHIYDKIQYLNFISTDTINVSEKDLSDG